MRFTHHADIYPISLSKRHISPTDIQIGHTIRTIVAVQTYYIILFVWTLSALLLSEKPWLWQGVISCCTRYRVSDPYKSRVLFRAVLFHILKLYGSWYECIRYWSHLYSMSSMPSTSNITEYKHNGQNRDDMAVYPWSNEPVEVCPGSYGTKRR